MRSPSSKLFLFTALTGVLLLPALSFAGPNGHHGKRHYKAQRNGQYGKAKRGPKGPYARAQRRQANRAHARRSVATHRHVNGWRHHARYRAPAPRRVVHVQRRVALPRTHTYVATHRYARPVAVGFRGDSVRLLQRSTCSRTAVRYPSGRVAAAGKCRRGLKRGTWVAYDRRGRTLARATFRRGVRLSSWTRHNGYGPVLYRHGHRVGRRSSTIVTPRRVRLQPTRMARRGGQRVRIAYNSL